MSLDGYNGLEFCYPDLLLSCRSFPLFGFYRNSTLSVNDVRPDSSTGQAPTVFCVGRLHSWNFGIKKKSRLFAAINNHQSHFWQMPIEVHKQDDNLQIVASLSSSNLELLQ